MSRKRHTSEQIIHKLREAEVELAKGEPLKLVCKKIGVTEQTYYRWRKEYGGANKEKSDPERARTSDLRFRKPLLYPAELRDRIEGIVALGRGFDEGAVGRGGAPGGGGGVRLGGPWGAGG